MQIAKLNKMVLDDLRCKPVLDPEFIPAVSWNKKYQELVFQNKRSQKFIISIENHVGNVCSFETKILPHNSHNKVLNIRYVERIVKFLLWMKGGSRIFMTGNKNLFNEISRIYSDDGERAFDNNFIGRTIFDMDLKFYHSSIDFIPRTYDGMIKLGGHMEGNRVGLDIGGTNKKYAIVINGEQTFAEGIPWNPRGQNDPEWFRREIGELIDLALKKVEHIDAIGSQLSRSVCSKQN